MAAKLNGALFFFFLTKTTLFEIQLQFYKFKLPLCFKTIPKKERFNLGHSMCLREFKMRDSLDR